MPATDVEHRQQGVLRFVEVRLLLEVHRVSEEGRRYEVELAGSMGFTCRPNDATQMRRLGPLAVELSAIALGGRPLVAEHIGSRRLPIGREQIDKSQRQKRPLPQTELWGSGRLVGLPLQEYRMGQARGARLQFSTHAQASLHLTCRTARPSRAPTYRSPCRSVRPQMARFRAFRRVFRVPKRFSDTV